MHMHYKSAACCHQTPVDSTPKFDIACYGPHVRTPLGQRVVYRCSLLLLKRRMWRPRRSKRGGQLFVWTNGQGLSVFPLLGGYCPWSSHGARFQPISNQPTTAQPPPQRAAVVFMAWRKAATFVWHLFFRGYRGTGAFLYCRRKLTYGWNYIF